MNLAYLLKSSKVLASVRAKSTPALFLPVAHLRESNKRRVIRKDTDVVIEGYWRCGNHFATYAFDFAQGGGQKIAHHFHAPAQLSLAVRWGVPAVLLIRKPVDAIASATVFLQEDNPSSMIEFYRLFHQSVLPLKSHLVVADFSVTVSDFGAVISALNAFYDRRFNGFDHNDCNVAQVKANIAAEHEANMGGVTATNPLPSESKVESKSRILDLLSEDRFRKRLQACDELYEELRESAVPSVLSSE